MDKLLTPKEAAERLRKTERFMRRLVAERRITFVKCGRAVRFPESAVEAYVKANTVEPISRQSVRRDLWRAA